jgi:ZPR1 zinc finger protein
MALGLQPSQAAWNDGTIQDDNPNHKNMINTTSANSIVLEDTTAIPLGSIGRHEVMTFPTDCPSCYQPTTTNMCITDIPHFKEVIIMSLACDNCGYTSREIKGGSAIPKCGRRIVVTVTSDEDLSREILKSDTAGIQIPEIGLELQEGGLGGMYTTLEGLLLSLGERLTEANPFGSGDGAVKQHRTNDGGDYSERSPANARFIALLDQLQEMAEGQRFPFTLILADPLANSFVGPVPKDARALALQVDTEGKTYCYDKYEDPGMTVEDFERTKEQNERLGLNDMKVEGYRDSSLNYGTDRMEEVSDGIRTRYARGPDHPHVVGKAPVEGDTVTMGPGSTHFCAPSFGQRRIGKSGLESKQQVTGIPAHANEAG